MLDQIVQQVMDTGEPVEDFQRTPYNASLVLGMCLKSFSSQPKSSKSTSSFDLAEISHRWGWSESVLDALASLAAAGYDMVPPQFLISLLTSFQLWMPRPIAAGENLPKPEGIAAIPLTVATAECSAYIFLPSCNKISRRKGGDQEVLAMRGYLDRCPRFPGACAMDWEVTPDCSRWPICYF
jgi:hypothetical protein